MASTWVLNTFSEETGSVVLIPKRYASNKGFSLVELTVVLLLITLIASVAVRETSELGFQTRYEQTKERLEMIRQAILGNPKLIVNGQQAVSGFVADMGRLPVNLRELVQRQGDCDNNLGDVNSAECIAVGGTWTASAWNSYSVAKNDPSTGLRYGWNGPYLSITGNPADNDALTDGWGRLPQGYCTDPIYTDETDCTNHTESWTAAAQDFNYGWYFDQLSANALTILSYGKDQTYSATATGYEIGYLELSSQPVIRDQDWLVDVSNGISVSFVKTTRALVISYCSDSSKITKATCLTTGTWYGVCDKAGFYNADSCTAASGNWGYCSDGTSTTQVACTTASGTWLYCSDRASLSQSACLAATPPGVWEIKGYGCSDQTYTTKDTCENNSKTWYGCADGSGVTIASCTTGWFVATNQTSNLPTMNTPICMKVFYRKPDSTIGALVSDGNSSNDTDGNVKFDPNVISADGSIQAIRFNNFRDSESSVAAIPVPLNIAIGSNAVAIYQYDGTSCKTSNLFYPNDRQNPIQVDFHPHTTLPVINW